MKNEQIHFVESIASILVERYHVNRDVANFIGCQFALESSYGTSYIASKFNNFCGMKTPLVRISVALNAGLSSERDYYAKYSSFEDCVLDYVLCLQYHRPYSRTFDSISYFKSFIRFYCPDSGYVEKIDNVYHSYLRSLKFISNAKTN